ncbi:MAG TPA: VWA domain-containing protein [Pyrinomonadaceae bacterium]
MRNLSSLFLTLTLGLSLPLGVIGQTGAAAPPGGNDPQKDDVVRVTTNLVQVDVVVTDADGKQVTDLRPEELEVFEDGKRRQLTNFSYVSTERARDAGPAAQGPAPSGKADAPKVAPALLRPEQVRRTIALVVDDLGLSFESIGYVRQALRKFVDEQMQPDDLVAIVRTSAGSGAGQQLTSDKRRLYAAIERVRWNPAGRGGDSPFSGTETNPGPPDVKAGLQIISEFEELRAARYSVGTISAVNYVVRGLADFPGRKSLVLISESFKLFTIEGRNVELLDSLRRLTDQANLASVSISTLDASGLQTLATTASDSVVKGYVFSPALLQPGGAALLPPPAARNTARVDQSINAQAQRDSLDAFRKLNALMDQRRQQNTESQSVLSYLASRTGGTFVSNRNDLGAGLQKIADDQKGYYLIGYRPEESIIDPKTGRRRFQQITVKVKRDGLRVRARAGYFGITDEEQRSLPRTRDAQLAAALTSPFASDGVGLRLTALFGHAPEGSSFIRALLQIDAQDLTFADEADGSRKVVFDVAAVNFGADGRPVEQLMETQTLSISKDAFQQVQRDGLLYSLNVPVKQPGAYQLRVAVRDATRGSVGAAGQFVEVPDLSKNRLALSGIVLNGTPAAAPASANSTPAGGAGQAAPESAQAGAAVRRLRQGMILNYGYTVFNATPDGASGRPQVQTQMRLFRDGKEVFTGRVLPLDAAQQADAKRLDAGGRLRIGPDLVPGQYVLQVVATDTLAKEKNRAATQWIDFEIVN